MATDFLKLARKIYNIFFSMHANDFHIRPQDVSVDAQGTSDKIYELLQGEKPCMIARYGSTELACINNYLSITSSSHSIWKFIQGKESEWWWNEKIMLQMQNWSGFFPPTKDKLAQYCELMIKDSTQLDVLGKWVSSEKNLENKMTNVFFTHLMYLEPFWCSRPWTLALKGKKVVVVHPFAELIEMQYHEKGPLLFSNLGVLPKFELRTVKAVQSLGGDTNDFEDWFAALNWMDQEIQKEEYDICLLGCGAYGFPLAASCKRNGKKAVHLGGSLQLLFGIIGNRWANPMYGVKEWEIKEQSYSSLINEHWIKPRNVGKPKNANNVEEACYW